MPSLLRMRSFAAESKSESEPESENRNDRVVLNLNALGSHTIYNFGVQYLMPSVSKSKIPYTRTCTYIYICLLFLFCNCCINAEHLVDQSFIFGLPFYTIIFFNFLILKYTFSVVKYIYIYIFWFIHIYSDAHSALVTIQYLI